MGYIMTFSYLDSIELSHILPIPLSDPLHSPLSLMSCLPHNKASLYSHVIHAYHEAM